MVRVFDHRFQQIVTHARDEWPASIASQTSELIRTLKRQKKQSRLVASTLRSLKQLQKAA